MHHDPEPVATYRLQLTPEQDLDAARALVPYLAELGISHLYLSPLFEAVPGSTHGYDVTDPTRVREALGGRPAFDRLREALDAHGLGLLLDIVPNHQATHADNPLWWSLLRDGPEGPGGRVFDADWGGGPDHPADTLLLPVLGETPAQAVAAGDLVLVAGDGDGEPELRYHDRRFPIRPGTLTAGEDAELAPEQLLSLLERQWYRLDDWRHGADDLSYRRFFDVAGLVGVRVEDPEVFDLTHRLIVELVREGDVQGLRVDHVDGVADPDGYLDHLAEATDGTWVVVEKILEDGERLPPPWLVDGTTGYEAGGLLAQLLHDPAGERALVDLFRDVTGSHCSWVDEVTRGKAEVLGRLFRPEHRRVTSLVAEALGTDDGEAVHGAVAALVVALDRYRTYPPRTGPMGPPEATVLAEAVARAVDAEPDPRRAALVERVGDLFLADGAPAAIEARTRFNQLTGAVTAKGIEDTALYRWIALPGAGDVGSAPVPLGRSLDDFHAAAHRSTAWPQGLVGTSTHDSKRSEDVRARLALLGEVAGEWDELVRGWCARLHGHPPGAGAPPDGLAALVLCQTLVGAWPLDVDRAQGYLRKAVREAKVDTSWTDPDERYEGAVEAMVAAAFADAELLGEVGAFVARLERPTRTNGLAQLLLKLTLPGIPDVYQGTEVWRHDLTDPDNRRPVDFGRRRRLLDEVRDAAPADVWPDDGSGRAKLWLLRRVLDVRNRHADAFVGPYAALRAEGPAADHLVAYVRGDQVAALVPRFPIALEAAGGWNGTVVRLPAGQWSDALGAGRTWQGEVAVADLLAPIPVALLVRPQGPAGV